jgi:polysaccharide biosynthesis transport protein
MSSAHDTSPDRSAALPSRAGQPALDRPRTSGVSSLAIRDPIHVSRRSTGQTEAHLLEHWRILLRHRWLVLTFLFVTIAMTAAWTFTMQPLFRANVMLRIEKEEPRVVKFDEPAKTDAAEEFYLTQYQLLQSRSLANSVIAALRLDQHPEFQARDRGWFGTAWHALRQQLKRLTPEPPAADPGASNGASTASPLTDKFLGQLTVEPVRNSRVVRVVFESHYPDLAARVVNTLADTFIAQQLHRKTDATRYGADFLTGQLDEAGRKLKDAEARLTEFLKTNQMFFSTSDKAGEYHDLITQQLSQVSDALLKARADRIAKESLYTQAVRHDADAVPAVTGNMLVGRLKEELAKLEAEYRRLAQTFKPEYPRMQQLERAIAELRGQLGREVSRILGGLDADYRAALLTERKLQGVVDSHQQLARKLGDGMPHYSLLRRDVDTNRHVYISLLTRLKEMQVSAALLTSNISLVDRGEIPLTPSRPRKALNLLLGVFVGLLGGVALAFLVEYFDTTVKDASDVHAVLRVPALGIVPHAVLKRKRVPLPRRMGARAGRSGVSAHRSRLEADPVFADAFRTLRTALLHCSPDCAPQMFMVTSPQRGEGKTTVAVGLAMALAHRGAGDVLLVDADLRRPTLHEVFGVRTTPGLANFLAAEADMPEVIRPTSTSNLYIVPAGRNSATLADLVASPRLASTLDILAGRFNYILFDTTPLLGVSDALSLAPHVGGAVLVLRHGHANREAARHAVRLLATIGTPLLGVILNRFDPKAAGAGYDYDDFRHRVRDAGVDDAAGPPADARGA